MTWGEVVSFALALGLGSSAHCVGMCGVFALKAASGSTPVVFSAYILGKVFTYAFLGAVVGSVGAQFLGESVEMRAWAGLVAATTLIIAGVFSLLPGRPLSKWTAMLGRWMAPMFAAVRTKNGIPGRFVLGAATGFLPCGIVYLAALQGVASGSIVKSVAFMTIFGFSTAPALSFVGFLSGRMSTLLRPRVIRVAGAGLLILIGGITVWRSLVPLLSDAGAATCCH